MFGRYFAYLIMKGFNKKEGRVVKGQNQLYHQGLKQVNSYEVLLTNTAIIFLTGPTVIESSFNNKL